MRAGSGPYGFVLAFALALTACAPHAPAAADAAASAYAYDDTKHLVALVDAAAAAIHADGLTSACAQFAQKNSRWYFGQYYLFVYALDGTAVCHAASPNLVGKHLMGLRDMNGKPIVRFITDIGKRPQADASGWVFYLWQEQSQLGPSWKSAYLRKVTAGGTTYVVGSGLYQMRTEKAWVQERVDAAAALLASKGEKAAFAQFEDPASPFVFNDTFVFVLDARGRTLVDPAYPTMAGRDLADFRDAVGNRPVAAAMRALQRADATWMQYLWPAPGSGEPTRKLIYLRKVVVDGKTLYVGTDLFLATPIWMRAG
ncbi:MAG TPA: cache domain-containing protein [Candidatus Baltobacteraceae bacterium]